MQSVNFKFVEFILLYIVIPVSFLWAYSPWIKLSIGLLGFVYVVYVLLTVEKITLKIAPNINWKQFYKATLFKLTGIALITSLYIFVVDKDRLFEVFLNKPLLWISILFIYSIFSVFPQELIYRTFFFQRYSRLVTNKKAVIFINAIVFSLAHLLFNSALVLLLTFLGGLLFAITYNKTKSTILVSIEHAIYGCWLFTVGMGYMLGFPT